MLPMNNFCGLGQRAHELIPCHSLVFISTVYEPGTRWAEHVLRVDDTDMA
jgi:hypothetical protein